MFDLEIKETRIYKEIKEEGREEGKEENNIEVAKRFIETVLSLEEIARVTRLPMEKILQMQVESTESQAKDENIS